MIRSETTKLALERAARERFVRAYESWARNQFKRANWRMKRLHRTLSVEELVRLDRLFRSDVRWLGASASRSVFGLFRRRAKAADTALILIHAPDGWLREAAIGSLESPERNALSLAALVIRANDWVEQVRNAAFQRLNEVVPKAEANVVVAMVPTLLDRAVNWERGGADVLEIFQARPDWGDLVKQSSLSEINGPMSSRLQGILETSLLDNALAEIASDARSSFARAVAVEAVLSGEVAWRVGYDWKWIEKPMGRRRRVAVWKRRTLRPSDADRSRVLQCAVRDKSAQVRKLTADVLIRDGLDQLDLLSVLAVDPSPAVLGRIDFAKRKWSGSTPID